LKGIRNLLTTSISYATLYPMKAIIEIKMDNAAFGQGSETALELSNVLARLGDNCERYLVSEVGHSATATDMNGNYVAKLEVVEND